MTEPTVSNQDTPGPHTHEVQGPIPGDWATTGPLDSNQLPSRDDAILAAVFRRGVLEGLRRGAESIERHLRDLAEPPLG